MFGQLRSKWVAVERIRRTTPSAGKQLLNSLVRQAEDMGRVADAQAAVRNQSAGRFTCSPGSGLLGDLRVLALLAGELQAGSDRRRQPYVLDKV